MHDVNLSLVVLVYWKLHVYGGIMTFAKVVYFYQFNGFWQSLCSVSYASVRLTFQLGCINLHVIMTVPAVVAGFV